MAQLRKLAAGGRRSHEADSGMARAQRLQHHGQHLRASGLPCQALLGGSDAVLPAPDIGATERALGRKRRAWYDDKLSLQEQRKKPRRP